MFGTDNEILPPQPYYIPGYTGWCPQYKFRCGRSFSQESHLILLDQTINQSNKSVLANTHSNLRSGSREDCGRPYVRGACTPGCQAQTYGIVEKVDFGNQPTRGGCTPGCHGIGDRADVGNLTSRGVCTPGYQGFRPCQQHFIGMSEVKACNLAIEKFEKMLERRRNHLEQIMGNNKICNLSKNNITKSILKEIRSRLN